MSENLYTAPIGGMYGNSSAFRGNLSCFKLQQVMSFKLVVKGAAANT